jgi:hypothetical protein
VRGEFLSALHTGRWCDHVRLGNDGPVGIQIGPHPKQTGPGVKSGNQGTILLWSSWTDWTTFSIEGAIVGGNIFFHRTLKRFEITTWLCVNPCVKMIPECAKAYQNWKRLAKE